jgi:hypothetical protein
MLQEVGKIQWIQLLTLQDEPNYVTATGGTVLTCGDFKTHIFTADGCFSVTAAGLPAGSTTIDYVVIGGGGGGGQCNIRWRWWRWYEII